MLADIAAQIVKAPAHEWLEEQYIVYSLYTIRDRALPDQDGLKPVNRRIIWDMFTLGALPSSGFVKAARVVGDVIGNFHPHGDASVADAMARMAQTFSLRVPLVDKSGSVGFVTGDTAAAPRYWEAKMSAAALELVKETKEGAVRLGRNFDGTRDEPSLLPVRWPNDIINGTKGLAVGFASNMPAHNPDETMLAAVAMLRNPAISVEEVMSIMPGPDFPTGGEVMEVDGIRDYFETGTGRFTVRGRCTVEPLTRGRVRIVFNELPYGISAENVMTKIHELRNAKESTRGRRKITVPPNETLAKGISNVQDLTDKKHGMRLVVTTSQGSDYRAVLNELFRTTPLQVPFSVNNTVLVDNFPVKVGVMDLLRSFLEFRRACTTNRCRFRLKRISHRTHQLDGLLEVVADIDKAVEVIRTSKDSDSARKRLMRTFKIDQEQADYILSMQLRRLTKADSLALRQERHDLLEEAAHLSKALENKADMDDMIEADLRDTLKVISSPRRTTVSKITSAQMKETQKAQDQARDTGKDGVCFVTRFADGTLLRTSEPFVSNPKARRLAHGPVTEQLAFHGDDNLVLVSSDGTGYRVPVSYLVLDEPGSAASMGVKMGKGAALAGVSKDTTEAGSTGLAMATRSGLVKVSRTDFPARNEFPVISLADGDSLVGCRWMGAGSVGTLFSLVTSSGNVLLFDAGSVNPTGSKAGGVKGVKLRGEGDAVVAFDWIQDRVGAVLVTSTGHSVKVTSLAEVPTKGRGSQGVAAQGMRAGESSIQTAYAGPCAVACAAKKGAKPVVALPEPSRRAARGAECELQLLLGTGTARPL